MNKKKIIFYCIFFFYTPEILLDHNLLRTYPSFDIKILLTHLRQIIYKSLQRVWMRKNLKNHMWMTIKRLSHPSFRLHCVAKMIDIDKRGGKQRHLAPKNFIFFALWTNNLLKLPPVNRKVVCLFENSFHFQFLNMCT